jgi:hypothetical protein
MGLLMELREQRSGSQNAVACALVESLEWITLELLELHLKHLLSYFVSVIACASVNY